MAGSLFTILGMSSKETNAYSCPSGYYCSPYGGVADGCRSWYDVRTKSYYCRCDRYEYGCSGTDSNCSGGFDYYTNSSCTGTSYYAGCCNEGSLCSCSDCTPPSCPSGTSESGSYGFYTQTSCDRGDCDDCGYSTRNCYCTGTCTPTACPAGYSGTNLGYGTGPTYSCVNGCNYTSSRTCYCSSLCSPTACTTAYSTTDLGVGLAYTNSCTNACSVASTRNCYYYPCNDCTLSCTAPLTLTNTGYPVSSTSCTRGGDCRGSIKTGTCYENSSPQPTGSITLNSPAGGPTSLGFTSTTTSGTSVNNSLGVIASFADTSGVADIEAVSVWFQTASGAPSTPQYIDGSVGAPAPKTYTNNSWGFMLHKEGSSWIPYIPSQNGVVDKWVKAIIVNGNFDIIGPSGAIVQVLNYNVVPTSSDVDVTFSLNFLEGEVATGNYNVHTMGHDVFGFTPYDNHAPTYNTNYAPGQIRYPNAWVDSTRDWYVDLEPPTVNSMNVEVENGELVITWDIADTQGIYGVVGNIYEFGMTNPDSLDITVNGSTSSYVPVEEPTAENIGHLTVEEAFVDRYCTTLPNCSTFPTTVLPARATATINVGGNDTGSITFYITVFDRGGNIDQDRITFDLSDWIVTRGGLLYASEGTDINARLLPSSAWVSAPLLGTAGFLSEYADISTEMLTSNNAIANDLIHSIERGSYEIAQFIGETDVQFYEDYKQSFTQKLEGKGGGFNLEEGEEILPYEGIGIFSSANSLCSTAGCLRYGIYTTTITVGSDFECNGKGVFFVEGDLVIEPNLTNSASGSDACVFVVDGNVSINQGNDISTAGAIGYDEVNTFILSTGIVTIESDSNFDGLLLRGGIYVPNNELIMGRKLTLENRNSFPALAVAHHSKYGIFAKDMFGNKIDLVKTEVGFKPY